MSGELRAVLIALLLVVFAAGIGIVVGQRARPSPTPRPAPSPTTMALPSATPLDPAEVQRRAFAQPLVAGCATSQAVWLFSDGGASVRWDGRIWTIPDPTLRSLLAAGCDGPTALAVGRGGSLLTIDDELRQVRVDRFGIEDLTALVRTSVGAVAVGDRGTVAEQGDVGWRLVETGAAEDLRGIASRDPRPLIKFPFAWIVGGGGASYRLMERGWERVPTGTTATLHTVLMLGDETALAAGEDGVLLRFASGRWEPIRTEVTGTLRAAAVVGTATWIVGDQGTVLELLGGTIKRVDLGTTCTLRAVFAQGPAVWIVGSDGTRGGAWRITATGTDRWGTC